MIERSLWEPVKSWKLSEATADIDAAWVVEVWVSAEPPKET